jgi:hypothetical protein
MPPCDRAGTLTRLTKKRAGLIVMCVCVLPCSHDGIEACLACEQPEGHGRQDHYSVAAKLACDRWMSSLAGGVELARPRSFAVLFNFGGLGTRVGDDLNVPWRHVIVPAR